MPRSPSLARRTFTLVRSFCRTHRGEAIHAEADTVGPYFTYVYLRAGHEILPLEQCSDARETAAWLAVGRLMLARAMETMG